MKQNASAHHTPTLPARADSPCAVKWNDRSISRRKADAQLAHVADGLTTRGSTVLKTRGR